MSQERNRFMQYAVPMLMVRPNVQKISDAVALGEQAWAALVAKGYTAKTEKQPRKTRPLHDYYAALSAFQREWFDKSWVAYRYKEGKLEAALAWSQLGELTIEKYQHIETAAKAEGQKPRPEGSPQRPHFSTWVRAGRFEDHAPSAGERKVTEIGANATRLRELKGKLAHAQQTYNLTKEDYWRNQVTTISAEIQKILDSMPKPAA